MIYLGNGENMKKFKGVIFVALALAFSGIMTTTQAQAQNMKQWIPRTVEEIRADLEENTNNGISAYTVKWGDTLYAISLAANVPMAQLANINSIQNFRLIAEGSIFYFNEDKTLISIQKGEEVESYNTVTGEKVDISVQEQNQAQHVALAQEQQQVEQPSQTQEQVVNDESPVISKQQEVVTETTTTTFPTTQAPATNSPKLYTLDRFMFLGVINWGGKKFTYYSQRVLPGGGLKIPGRHVNADGYVADKDGYIVVANNAPLGTIIDTPFGYKGKVYDRGTVGNHFDVYVR